MPHQALPILWDDAPFAMLVYRPAFDGDGTLNDLDMVWANKFTYQIGAYTFDERRSLRQILGEDRWPDIKAIHEYVLETGKPKSYSRSSYRLDGRPLDYSATVWTAGGYIGLLMRDYASPILSLAQQDEVNHQLSLMRERERLMSEILSAFMPAPVDEPAF